MVTNHKMAKQIRELLSTLDKGVTVREVMRAAGTNHHQLKKWAGYKEGICPCFSGGGCDWAGCQSAHLFEDELPNGYAANYCSIVAPGVAKIVSGDYQPSKRQRSG